MTMTGQVDDDAKLASTDFDHTCSGMTHGRHEHLVDSGSMGDTKVTSATLTQSAATERPGQHFSNPR